MTDQNIGTNQRQTGEQRGSTTSSGLRVLRGLIRGFVGGLIATVLMTLYRFPVFRALPPTADFWAKYVGGEDAEAHLTVGLALHFLYGGIAGGLFGVGISLSTFRNEREHDLGVIGLALVYGLALSAFGTRFVFRYLLDEELKPDEAVIFHVGHVIYGLTLGTWISFRARKGEVYD
ncbi:hypothetical protein [Halorubrum sp. DTA46]|uniref:hypothetical protein n=1 Tax=Halorubrum sp. DTA46 TaxID=3402162 RepID=UPI003AAB4D5F